MILAAGRFEMCIGLASQVVGTAEAPLLARLRNPGPITYWMPQVRTLRGDPRGAAGHA
jgi:hypothetical protein